IVLVHGGYWRERLTFELMLPLVPLWTREGANVANVEYRRGPAAPWPLPLQDVQEAMYTIREHVPGKLIGVGHSVGGQLALLLNTGFDAVVALAPVTDVVKVYYAGLGEEAAAEYFQTSPGAQPGLFASASPINHSLGPTPVLMVHGENDERVPLCHSWDYARIQWSKKANIDMQLVGDLNHMGCIDPSHDIWKSVQTWLRQNL